MCLWDLQTQDLSQKRIELTEHLAPVEAIAVSADSKRLVSSDSNGRVLLWDLTSTNPSTVSPVNLPGHREKVFALTLSENWVASGSYDNTVKLWPLSLDILRKKAWLTAGYRLSNEQWQNYLQGKGLSNEKAK